jgi:hypothetical protein
LEIFLLLSFPTPQWAEWICRMYRIHELRKWSLREHLAPKDIIGYSYGHSGAFRKDGVLLYSYYSYNTSLLFLWLRIPRSVEE